MDRMFKVGDRVQVKQDNAHAARVNAGDTGTITAEEWDSVFRVKMDNPRSSATSWLFEPPDLELVSSVTSYAVDENLNGYETVALENLPDVLNPDDPFERVLIDMVATNRRKRADYAVDGSPWSNFDDTANALGIDGFTPVDSVNFNIEQKSARLRSLRKNGRMTDPRNESVTDTYLDRAVYAVIALAMHTYPTGKVEATDEDAA